MTQLKPLALKPLPKDSSPEEPETIISCAVLYKGGIFTLPNTKRYHVLWAEMHNAGCENPSWLSTKGFYTSKGRFLTPYEGYMLASTNGQYSPPSWSHATTIYPVDIWHYDK